ncbi:transcriptional regulatory protein moc3 [Podospora australis]|uniref:Transcriptional regulatory protein moc3 n=1 Tax=Podospora australis TaxID=1536484 RepID=A0AAN6X2E6_9PEZI|nr:transcriptional regulatory protein moc3 [Podospora australis]
MADGSSDRHRPNPPPALTLKNPGNTKASSPSVSATSSPTTSQAPRKRTRASKPKVRTGCITCKIRRVKCGEEKPACLRCTSTGRTCDGYDKGAVTRYRTPNPNHTAELAKVEFVKACQWSEALRSMRTIAADIDGTEAEKRFFARFRTATVEVDSLATHMCNFTAFWNRVAPSTSYQDEAVKHAVVALGGAYMLFQYPDQQVIDGFTRDSLELFVIQQYNKSIEKLQRHVGSSSQESIRITLLCCLTFISLETLRTNHSVAVTHLINGLRILNSLPPPVFECLSDPNIFVWPPTSTSLDMPDIIQIFARLEVSTCFFTTGLQPVISEKGYTSRFFDDGSTLPPYFRDVTQLRRSICTFQHDAMAYLHSSSSSVSPRGRKYNCLVARSTLLGRLVDDFFSPSRFGNPIPATPESYCMYLDVLSFRCAQFLVSLIPSLSPPPIPASLALNPFLISFTAPEPVSAPPPAPAPPPPPVDENKLGAIMSLVRLLSSSPIAPKLRCCRPFSSTTPITTSPQQPTPITRTLMDTGLLGPLYLVAIHTAEPSLRAAAIRLLADNLNPYVPSSSASLLPTPTSPLAVRNQHTLENTLVSIIETERAEIALMRRGDQHGERERRRTGMGFYDAPRALTGVGSLPRVWDALVPGDGGYDNDNSFTYEGVVSDRGGNW